MRSHADRCLIRALRATLAVHLASLLESASLPELLEAENQDRFVSLVDWLQEGIQEAGLNDQQPALRDTFELRQSKFGLTLFSKKRFETGAVLAMLPRSRLLSTSVDCDGTVNLPVGAL